MSKINEAGFIIELADNVENLVIEKAAQLSSAPGGLPPLEVSMSIVGHFGEPDRPAYVALCIEVMERCDFKKQHFSNAAHEQSLSEEVRPVLHAVWRDIADQAKLKINDDSLSRFKEPLEGSVNLWGSPEGLASYDGTNTYFVSALLDLRNEDLKRIMEAAKGLREPPRLPKVL